MADKMKRTLILLFGVLYFASSPGMAAAQATVYKKLNISEFFKLAA